MASSPSATRHSVQRRQVQGAAWHPRRTPGRLRKMHAPSTTRVLDRRSSPKIPPSPAASWCSKRSGSRVAASAPIMRASSSPSSSAPIEQQPWPRSGAGSARMPRQPRPQRQVQLLLRNSPSNRQRTSPASISSMPSATSSIALALPPYATRERSGGVVTRRAPDESNGGARMADLMPMIHTERGALAGVPRGR